METKRYRLQGAGALSVPAADAEKLLSLRDGECALLYLHILASGGELDASRAVRDLGRPEEQIRAAADRLGKAGLLTAESGRPLPPPDTRPEYRVEDIVRRSREDRAFQGLVTETQRVLGHALSGPDLQTLFSIYDQLGMAPEVIMLMINHVAAQLRRRYGEGRLPSMHALRKEAYHWANQEILTLEQAEEYVAARERMETESEKVRRALQIADRPLTPTERKYLESWLSMGFSSETLSEAYDRTVVSTNRLVWAYMDKIVRSWYEKGLFTPEDVERGDPRVRPRTGRTELSQTTAVPRGDDLDRLEQMMNIKE